jgi:urocanate hydratase
MTKSEFKKLIAEGIPTELPELKSYDQNINHAPRRKDILNSSEKKTCPEERTQIFS